MKIKTGAEQTEKYIPFLQDKKVAVVANHSTVINGTHLVDSLLALGIDVKKIFSPEHGFRGIADAGELVDDDIDNKTGLQVVSLYGSSKKPLAKDLKNIDVVVFDLQDVGVRFYTYISTMHYVMEACAENKVEMVILDRPNPNGFYIDGPVLDSVYQSFVGMHPVPIVHGMTIAEFAQMINGEGWLKNGLKCNLSFIACDNYTHDSLYQISTPPSPNLQNMLAIYLYPSLGFFEGIALNVGRGTDFPFQVFGSPELQNAEFSYTPKSMNGSSKNPKHKNQKCYGVDLRNIDIKQLVALRKINLEWLIFGYQNSADKENFFNTFFYNISGTSTLNKQIEKGFSAAEIRESWEPGLEEFQKIREKYLIYPDFEK
ncbi:MAG: exo-beta-N-acetylmuramidase NamZ domain-containing protein [Bacteroidota bacterium]